MLIATSTLNYKPFVGNKSICTMHLKKDHLKFMLGYT